MALRTFAATGPGLKRADLAVGLLAALAWAAPAAAQAQTSPISAIEVPANALAGNAVAIVIRAGPNPSRWCGFRIDFGDGDGRDIKVDGDQPFPITLSRSYARPGQYTVDVVGKRVTTHSPCDGKLSAKLTVIEPVVAVLTPPPAPRADAACPETVQIRNAAGQDVSFGLRQMVLDAGGVQQAGAQVDKRIIETQDRALADGTPADEVTRSKQFIASLKSLKDKLQLCR